MTPAPQQARFHPGDRVRIEGRSEDRHHRVPAYVKGHVGVVTKVCGIYQEPERIAYGLQDAGRRLYRVRLQQTDLWPAYPGPAIDTLDVEIFEHWLESA